MLSEKKMVLRQSSIDFLGVNISDGKYTLQPHIAISLGEFLDNLTSTKKIQQFLGIVIICQTLFQKSPNTGIVYLNC